MIHSQLIQAKNDFIMRDGTKAIIAGHWYSINKIGYAYINVINESGTGQHIFSGKDYYDTFNRNF